jgi:hypothetical protein
MIVFKLMYCAVWYNLTSLSEVLATTIIRAIIALMIDAASTPVMLVNFYETAQCSNP